RLLELARQYYQRFQRQQGDDPSLMKELALTFERSGVISNEFGDAAEAQIALLRAMDILGELCRADRKDAALRVELARCYIEIGQAVGPNNGPNEESFNAMHVNMNNLSYVHDPVPLLESLVADDPKNLDYLRLLGR